MSGKDQVLVRAERLVKLFASRTGPLSGERPPVRAVDGIDLTVNRGEILGLVGESGSGKSTTGRLLTRLMVPDDGRVLFDGVDLFAIDGKPLRTLRKRFQIIFQDPYGSLNPRMKVGSIVSEPLVIHRMGKNRTQREDMTVSLLEQVGLDSSALDRYPHEFSGGQRQRIGIARALACSPEFIVADEPVSALDPPIQAQIINLMIELRRKHDLSYLFIAHDLRLVEHVCDRVAVMYLGKIVEEGPAGSLYTDPRHPYTRALLDSTPAVRPGKPAPPALSGELPSGGRPPAGCSFHPRCPVAEPACSMTDPALKTCGTESRVACHLAETSR